MAIQIPGLSMLYAIHKRNIDRENDILVQRKRLADELMNNCRIWAKELLATFDVAVRRWKADGRGAAQKEILELEHDFMKLNYWSLESSSPIFIFLREDHQFEEFVISCSKFYKSALYIKRLVYGEIEAYPGHYVSEGSVGIEEMVRLWKIEVEKMLYNVSVNHMKIQIIQQS